MRADVTIRYIGNEDIGRRYLLQRQDGLLHTGRGWATRPEEARLYDKLSTAQRAYRALLNRKHRGKPRREFRVELDLTVRGSGRFSLDDLRRYLAQALHLNFDNAAAGDGPSGTFVQAVAVLCSLREMQADAKGRSKGEAE